VGGQWAGPPEDCGDRKSFLEWRAAAPWRVRELLDDLLEDIKTGDTEALDYRLEELQPWQECACEPTKSLDLSSKNPPVCSAT
jgi:hypothetical protein